MRIILIALVLAGCAQMTNHEIITQTRLCESNGLVAVARYHPLDGSVSRVTCLPPDSPVVQRNRFVQ